MRKAAALIGSSWQAHQRRSRCGLDLERNRRRRGGRGAQRRIQRTPSKALPPPYSVFSAPPRLPPSSASARRQPIERAEEAILLAQRLQVLVGLVGPPVPEALLDRALDGGERVLDPADPRVAAGEIVVR